MSSACIEENPTAPVPEAPASLSSRLDAALSSISMSEKAAAHVNKFMRKRGKGLGVRLGVKTTGCSGLAYKLEYVDEAAPEDTTFETQGIKIFVDPKSLPYLRGMQLDFERQGLNEGFKFNNPNVKDLCGCGESFRV